MSLATVPTRPPLGSHQRDRTQLHADRARQVLAVDSLIVAVSGGDELAHRIIASSGSPGLDQKSLHLLRRHELQTTSETSPHDLCTEVPSGSWITAPICGTDRVLGSLHILTPRGWRLNQLTQQMLNVFVDRFSELLRSRACMSSDAVADEDLMSVARAMARLALAAETYEALVGGVTAAVAPLFGASKAGIGVWHGDSHYLQLLEGSFGSDAVMAASSQIRGSDPNSGAARVRSSGKPYFTNDLPHDMPKYAVWLQAMGVTKRLMTLPIPITGRIGGVLHIANKDTDFVVEDMDRGLRMLPFVAGAVEHVRLRLEARRNEALAAVVGRAATAVAHRSPLTRFRVSVLDEFCRSIGACMLAIFFTDGTAPVIIGGGSVDAATEEVFLNASANGGSALRTATRRPRAARDVGWTALHAPVVIGGTSEATVSLLRVPCEAFSKDELAAVRRMATVTALAWATDRIQQGRLESARMRERERIADDLHDHVAQVLFTGQLTVQSILEQLDEDEPLFPTATRARDLLARSQTLVRDIIYQLGSAGPGGFIARLATVAETVAEEFGMAVHLSVAPAVASLTEDIPGPTGEIVLRSVREAIVNAAKHAHGSQAWVVVRPRHHRLFIAVEDDGPGMMAGQLTEGYGLRAMRRNLGEHGCSLRIGKSRRGGTRTVIVVPLGIVHVGAGDAPDHY